MPYRVCIDPGHGGDDPGAVGPTGLREKDVTLAVCGLLADMLVRTGQIEVRFTRDGDYVPGGSASLDLYARCRIANQWGADIFISVHCNSARRLFAWLLAVMESAWPEPFSLP
jgi:N-acetylmuramoyl-L-alanine amidase